MRRTLLMIAVALAASSEAQVAETFSRPVDEFRSRCIPLWSDAPDPNCTVAEFREFAKLDGTYLLFALYDDRSKPVPDWMTSYSQTSNALVLLSADRRDLDVATVLHVRKPKPGTERRSYRFPELIQTDLGPVFYLQGDGLGDGSFQFQYDEYWLWRAETLVPLDVHGWLYPMRERMPTGFKLKGIGDLRDALRTLSYVTSDVARGGDADCCPTGGTVRIRHKWDHLTLRVASFEHEPRQSGTESM